MSAEWQSRRWLVGPGVGCQAHVFPATAPPVINLVLDGPRRVAPNGTPRAPCRASAAGLARAEARVAADVVHDLIPAVVRAVRVICEAYRDVGEAVILTHPPLTSVGVSIGMEKGCQQNDRTLANG